MPHLHLSSLVTKKKNRDRRYIFSFYLALMHISLPRTPVIYNKMCTSLPRPYPSVHPSADSPLVHTAAAPDPTDAATGKTDAAAGKTGTPTEHPATAHPTSTTCGQPSVTTTPNVGAPFMTPVARQGETTGGPNTPATTRLTPRDCPCDRHLAAYGRQRAS